MLTFNAGPVTLATVGRQNEKKKKKEDEVSVLHRVTNALSPP